MAGHIVLLELPEAMYRWAERTERTTEGIMESVLVEALNTARHLVVEYSAITRPVASCLSR
jgi:hypothetical protein